jgi:hypothetical protein
LAVLLGKADAVLIDQFTSATTGQAGGTVFGCALGAAPGTCFVTGMNVAQATIGSTTETDVGLPDVFGGSRQLTVVADSLLNIFPPDLVVAGVVPLVAFLEYDSTAQADGRFRLLYDSAGSGLGRIADVPLEVRVTVLEADVASVDCAPPPMPCTPGYDVTVTLRDTASHTASWTETVLIPGGPITLSFPFSKFPGVDGSKLFSLEVEVDPNVAGDLRLDRIEVIGTTTAPLLSPRLLALLALCLTLVGAQALRRQSPSL